LLLFNAIFKPVVSHVEGFGSFHSDFGVKDAVSSRVVSFERVPVGGLFVTHLFKRSDKRDGFLGVEKKTRSFCLGC
jgi:hypothetical protein